MIALGIQYLTKYAVATNLARQQPEWPPHPGRVFMAMVAAYFETGADAAERKALEWLEAAAAPAMRASEADERTSIRAYVPVNDVEFGLIRRPRQDRGFLRTRPHDDCVYLIWKDEPPPETRAALANVCRKVTRVGHSMSAVQMWVVPRGQELEANWLPGTGNQDSQFRVTAAGTLRSLEIAFNGEAIQEYDSVVEALRSARGKERTRLKSGIGTRFPNGQPESRRPQIMDWQGYGRATEIKEERPVLDGPFDEDFVVLTKLEGPALGLETALQLTGALRNYALKPFGKSSPEWLSGHDPADAPTLYPHVAFFPLPYVGTDYADGHVLGLGVAVPRDLRLAYCATRVEEMRKFLGRLFFDPDTGEEREITLWNRDVWKWTLEREKRERPPLSLQRLSWTKPSRRWGSITPVVLHHYPKKREGDVERIVREAFVSALLPEPQSVSIRSVSAVKGAGHAMEMPPFAEGGANLCRYQTHVVATFAEPLRGPVLVGRGRFRGYGLFRPLAAGEGDQ